LSPISTLAARTATLETKLDRVGEGLAGVEGALDELAKRQPLEEEAHQRDSGTIFRILKNCKKKVKILLKIIFLKIIFKKK
jgi:hypothetical protein